MSTTRKVKIVTPAAAPPVTTPDVETAPETPVADIAGMRKRLAAAVQSNAGTLDTALSMDEAMDQTVRTYGTQEFVILFPTLFQTRDMYRSLIALNKQSVIDPEVTEAMTPDEMFEHMAGLQEQQLSIVLPCLHVVDQGTLKRRPATPEEAGYNIREQDLSELITILMPTTTAKKEMQAAGIDDPK